MDLDSVIDELYGLDPGHFTARRDALSAEARKQGDRALAAAIKALRRPSLAAHTVNVMARSHGEEIARLVELGARLREAQAALSGDELRALGRQRQQVVAGLAREARAAAREAGHPISDSVQREIEATFEAALADEAAGRAVAEGRLVRALERSGMDPVELEGAVAGGTGPAGEVAGRRRPDARDGGRQEGPAQEKDRVEERARAERRARAEEAAREAEEASQEAERRLADAAADHEAAKRRREQAEDAVRRLRDELAAAGGEADRALEEEHAARRSRLRAEEEAETAAGAARRARAQADSL